MEDDEDEAPPSAQPQPHHRLWEAMSLRKGATSDAPRATKRGRHPATCTQSARALKISESPKQRHYQQEEEEQQQQQQPRSTSTSAITFLATRVLRSGVALPNRDFFDPWNTSTTGHQKADHAPSQLTSWKKERQRRVVAQCQGIDALSMTAGQGRQTTLSECFSKMNNQKNDKPKSNPGFGGKENLSEDLDEAEQPGPTKNGIFGGLVVYINGSTAPFISDHKLKYLLVNHGAQINLMLSRRAVTHVILGNRGAGGGLAAGKLQKEIRTVRGKGIKFVSVEWVLESIKAGKRLPEARFINWKVVPARQESVLRSFKPTKPSSRVDC